MDEEELMMHLINNGTQVAGDDGAKNNVQEDANDGSKYLALEQNEQEDIGQVYIFLLLAIYINICLMCARDIKNNVYVL
jgi:hypothetical protein